MAIPKTNSNTKFSWDCNEKHFNVCGVLLPPAQDCFHGSYLDTLKVCSRDAADGFGGEVPPLTAALVLATFRGFSGMSRLAWFFFLGTSILDQVLACKTRRTLLWVAIRNPVGAKQIDRRMSSRRGKQSARVRVSVFSNKLLRLTIWRWWDQHTASRKTVIEKTRLSGVQKVAMVLIGHVRKSTSVTTWVYTVPLSRMVFQVKQHVANPPFAQSRP